MKSPLLVVFLAAAALLPACSSQPVVSTQARQGVDLSRYKSFAFLPGAGTDAMGITSISAAQLKAAVRSEMTARGYAYVEASPELLVDFSAGVSVRPKNNYGPRINLGAFGQYGGVSVDVPVGTGVTDDKVTRIRVELLDNVRREAVWEGVYEGVMTGPELADPALAVQKAVHGMFMKFPIQ
jgi:hypothetical protein